MEVLDTSIANVALPHMAGSGRQPGRSDLGADQLPGVERGRSAYLRLALEPFRPQALLHDCVAMFTVCSLLCGLAPTLPLLILARILQGLGGGGLAPSEQAILADTFPVEKRGQAFALYGMAVVVAPAIGPTWAAGSRTTSTGTGSSSSTCPSASFPCFSPTGWWKIRPTGEGAQQAGNPSRQDGARPGGARRRLPGVCAGQGPGEGLVRRPDDITFTFAGYRHAGLLCVVGVAAPGSDRRLEAVEEPQFRHGSVSQFILGMVLFSTTVLIPQFLQVLMGYTAERAGMALSPAGLVLMVMMPVAGRTWCKDGPAADGDARISGHPAGPLQHDPAGPELSFGHSDAVARVPGARTAVHLHPHQHAELCGCARDKNNQISSFSNFARNFGGSMGTALLTTYLARSAQVHQMNLASHFSAGSAAVTAQVERFAMLTHSSFAAARMPGPGADLWADATAGDDAGVQECIRDSCRDGSATVAACVDHAAAAKEREGRSRADGSTLATPR